MYYTDTLTHKACFNSILVRLKGENIVQVTVYSDEFQFHTGSIKSEDVKVVPAGGSLVSIPYWFD